MDSFNFNNININMYCPEDWTTFFQTPYTAEVPLTAPTGIQTPSPTRPTAPKTNTRGRPRNTHKYTRREISFMKRDHDRLRRGVAHLYQMGQKYSRRSWINYCVEQYRNTNWVPTQYADEVLAQINPHGAPQVPVVSVVPLVSTPDSAVDMQQDWNYDSGAEMSLEQIMAANPNGAEMMLEPFQALNNSWLSGFEFELPTFGMDVLEPSWGLMTQQQPEDPAAMACLGYQQEVERQQVVSTYEVAGGAPDVPVRADTVGSGVQGSGYIDPALLCNNTIGSSMEEIGEWLQQLDRAPGAGGYVWIGGDDVAAEGVLSDSSIDALMARFTESGEEEAKDEAEFDDGEFDDLF